MTAPTKLKPITSRSSRGRKFDAVLEGARAVFMRDGFEGASVDDITRAAGVSKATVYSYFPDKREMFTEVTRRECERMAKTTLEEIDFSRAPREVMLRTARNLTRFLLSDFSLQMFRICVAEAERFPDLGHAFYRNGPEMGRNRMVEYIKEAQARGELIESDPDMMAEQFAELCKTRLWTRAVFGVQVTFSDEEIEEVSGEAVETMMARYEA
ncbi:MAG: TetR/AcrR family transcriptional regulator [Spiribacter salinus]|uniref:TetR/AcrR family transcriptional regulator n=1 Tax=Spiribacter salinus TaxID=1335746 RepID=A0A540VSZ3_9GAMM|nr:MAG: TetR/AcrR family transcriptional regulator [Spiribacter salinus]